MGKVRTFLVFCAAVLAMVLALGFLNWVPSALQREGIARYRTLEDVASRLKIRKVFLPSYFPQYLSWPPDEILARKKPYPLVLMHFNNLQRAEIALAIRQSDVRDQDPVKSRIEPVTIHSREEIAIKGRPARLLIATCPGKRACNAVTWQENGYAFTVIAKDSAEEVIKIAESMLAGAPPPEAR